VRLSFIFRLFLDLAAACLLLAALAYDWLGNISHEVIGAGMFLLLISHNVFNRRWYNVLSKGWREPRVMFSKGITITLLLVMTALLITSVMISRTLFSFLPLPNSFFLRQVHALLGYLVLFIAAFHIGLRWSIVMRFVRNAIGLDADSRIRTYGLRGMALVVAAYGAYSLTIVDVGSKLMMEMSFGIWDFETAAAAFLVHVSSIVGLGAFISHYAMKTLNSAKRKTRSTKVKRGA
jgi:hypothetical protein